MFLHDNDPHRVHSSFEEFISPQESLIEDSEENFSTETLSVHKSPLVSDFESEEAGVAATEEEFRLRDADSVHKSPLVSDFESEEAGVVATEEEFPPRDADSVSNSVPVESRPTSPITLNLYKSDLVDSDKNCEGTFHIIARLYSLYSLLHYSHAQLLVQLLLMLLYAEDHAGLGLIKNKKVQEANLTRDERFFVLGPTQLETKKHIVEEKYDEEIFGDSCTVGSTSKSSSEWRSSIKDSGTEDPFSSSSRRSCPKWESYTVFQKYDEEMSFLGRISAQKLHETGNALCLI